MSETTKHAFDNINFFKHSTKRAKAFFKHDKDKDIKVIETIDNIKDDNVKSETIKDFYNSNNQKAIAIEKIHAVKYVAGLAIMGAVAIFVNQTNQKQERDCQ
ncbi:hypothetical protein IIK_05818 [Bacillus cereus VD102]|nr:hypothetical protein IIK_05818 [Bacillus cereus VD102]